VTDPRLALQVDTEVFARMDPLERARWRGERVEAQEARQEEAHRAAKRQEVEDNLARQEMLERQQIIERGYTDRELAHLRAEESAVREEKIAELEAELAKLDPARTVKRAETQRAVQAAEDARLLEAARAVSPFMAAEIARFHRRQGREVSRSSRPFDVSRGLGDGDFDVPDCAECVKAGATAEESALIHLDPEAPAPVQQADQVRYGGTGWPAEISR
jgi:hypothetical protein